MFTYNFEQQITEELMPSLQELVAGRRKGGDEAAYGEVMLRKAGPERPRHLEQRLQVWEEGING